MADLSRPKKLSKKLRNNMDNLTLSTKNTWCPGCGNFLVFESLKKAIINLEKKGAQRENFVLVSGIGCHAKTSDYVNINTFYGLHGRALALAQGVKVGNPDLEVICCSGDGDSYNEGVSHLIHAAKRNSDITVIIHDNQNFALTVKQFTSTSPRGFKGSTTPQGSVEDPLNPLELVFASGATFVARGYAGQKEHLTDIIEQAIKHKGFSFVEVLQPCVAWHNTFEKYNQKVYQAKKPSSLEQTQSLIKEWDYRNGGKIPIGVFYEIEKPCFEEELSLLDKKKINVASLLKKHA
jgi:2-oxoglutarate/2-oxoacid ferredoxin oxidoreductase subunit beta